METRHVIETVEELKKKFSPVENVNVVHKSRLSSIDRLALFITKRVGTMGFFFIIFSWTLLWLLWNIFAPQNSRFDPFPAFVLWLFISNMIQLHLMPLIMVGQNLQGQHAELRSEREFATNKKAEKEIETILLHLEHQEKLIEELHEKIDSLEKK